jgi:hypothetical protein
MAEEVFHGMKQLSHFLFGLAELKTKSSGTCCEGQM